MLFLTTLAVLLPLTSTLQPSLPRRAFLHSSVSLPLLIPFTSLAAPEPSQTSVTKLRDSLSALYGDKDAEKALPLLRDTVESWDGPEKDLGSIYRCRGDAAMEVKGWEEARDSYNKALTYLNGNDADGEVSLSTTGLARSRKALGSYSGLSTQYRAAVVAVGKGDKYAETEEDMLESGISRNPYLGWEYGDALKREGKDFSAAFKILDASGDAFEGVGDPVRGYISQVDSCIALSTYDPKSATSKLERIVPKSTKLESRDVELLQRAIGKECEGRVMMASLYWEAGDKAKAEDAFGMAEERLSQLEEDYVKRIKGKKATNGKDRMRGFNIDDSGPEVGEVSAAKFKKSEWVAETLGWGDVNGARLNKFIKLT